MNCVLPRLGSALLAALATVAAVEIWRIGTRTGNWTSGLAFVAFIVAVSGACLCGLATVAPARWWQVVVERLQSFARSVRNTCPISGGWMSVGLMAIAFAMYVVLASHRIQAHDPTGDDEGAYLATAQEIRDAGGVSGLLIDLVRGKFAEANRHPLYLALLSFRPTLMAGRTLSAVIGGVALVILTAGVAHRFGALAGGLFALLLATNQAYCSATSLVAAEGLLVLCSGAAWLLLLRSPSITPMRAFVIGGLLGFAYLAKGTATLLLGTFVIWLVLRAFLHLPRPQRECVRLGDRSTQNSLTPALSQRERGSEGLLAELASGEPRPSKRIVAVVLMVTGWILVASPLLARNTIRYGSPLHNVNSWLLFVDEYENPVALSESRSLGDVAREYLQSHTLRQILGRAVKGVVWETFIVLRSLGPLPLDDSRVLFGALLFLCSLVGMIADWRDDVPLVLIWAAVFLVFFGWYVPIAAGDRFVLPLVVPLLAYAASGLTRLWGAARRERSAIQ